MSQLLAHWPTTNRPFPGTVPGSAERFSSTMPTTSQPDQTIVNLINHRHGNDMQPLTGAAPGCSRSLTP
eukprot:5884722-Lingulodinium_polyedra.AAC.1